MILVSTAWLDEHITAPDLVIVDASWYLPAQNRDPRAEYAAGHIPGAVYFDIDEIADKSSGLPHMMPSGEEFARHMNRLGIGDGMRIVIYDGAGLFSAPRAWWMLRSFGAQDVSILDGGAPAWRAEGRAWTSDITTRRPATFTPRFNHGAVADAADIAAALKTGNAQIVDARPADRFRGEAPEPRPGLRSGHMPGSRSLPASRLIADGKLKSPAEIKAELKAADIDPERPVITTCGSGVSAAILSLGLEMIGRPATGLYDASWAEWGAGTERPVATGEA